ncbi:proline-rich transmembrane protein 1-like [Haliotis rubra]|uniref:proline-rich transmembrane protein 1-like n=1 Tax=Haliotis rubra TaxID=36100 RepID=UPI001EE55A25|nr:proline-rich transmembrane protein 1-like [Haliotis rubra]
MEVRVIQHIKDIRVTRNIRDTTNTASTLVQRVGMCHPPPNYSHRYRLQSIATTTSRPSMDVRDLMEDDNDFNSHLALSVFSTACCCLPIGILAISKSQDAKLHYNRGDLELAHYASMDAKKYAYWAMAVGTIVFVVIAMAVIIILSYHL